MTTITTSEGAVFITIPPGGIALEEIERQAVIEALRMSNWIQKDAAALLRISPRVMHYKIKILAISLPQRRRVMVEPERGVTSFEPNHARERTMSLIQSEARSR